MRVAYDEEEVPAVEVHYDEAKFTEMVVYVAERLRGDKAGGATKLNKALYFADFAHTRHHGRPISGAAYQRLERGPAPRRLVPVRSQLIARGDAELIPEDFLGHTQQRLVPRRAADASLFTPDELATIDAVLGDLEGLTATAVSDLSHDEAPWRLTDPGSDIAYELAFVAREQAVTPTARRLAREVAERYGVAADT